MSYRLTPKRKRRLAIFLVVLAIIAITFIILREHDRDNAPAVPDAFNIAQRTWREQGSDHYQMTVTTYVMPVTRIDLHVVVENGVIVDEILLPCESACDDEMRESFTSVARHTIDDLFERAARCLIETRLVLRDCPALPDNFQQFETRDEMSQVATSCEINTGDEINSLCSVRYNTTYGYPEEIFVSVPRAFDANGLITVTDFQLIEDSAE